MYLLDYRNWALSGAAIKNAGYGGTIRYIDDLTNRSLLNDKHITLAEYKDHLAHGLTVHLVMEVNTGDANGGFARGVEYAKRAKRGADVLGYTGVIFFCNDTTEVNASAWTQYLKGAASILGWNRTGAYGFANAMDIANSQTDCKYFWEAGRRSDADARKSWLNFWQDNNTTVTVAGRQCDRNLVMNPIKTVGGDDELLADEKQMLKDVREWVARIEKAVSDTDNNGGVYRIQKDLGYQNGLIRQAQDAASSAQVAANTALAAIAALDQKVSNIGTPDVDETAIAIAVAQAINVDGISAEEIKTAVVEAIREQWNK